MENMMENIMKTIKPELLALIPVLYFIGMGLKRAQAVADKWIPLLLGGIGILLALIWVLAGTPLPDVRHLLQAVFSAVTQGILCAGCAVYTHQIGKQAKKEE